jgi:hypothetical protein
MLWVDNDGVMGLPLVDRLNRLAGC